MSDLDYFFLQLKLIMKVPLYERQSLIIFDEVQLCPKARQAIKTLVKDHRFDYIETGSLISIRKNIKDILIPSEEMKLEMYPMDYEEFLWAINEEDAAYLLKELYEIETPIGEGTNRLLMRRFKLYMLIGGMPQAVDAYLKTNDHREVDKVKRDIISLYEDDFKKIDPSGRLGLMFEAIPSQLNKNKTTYKIQSIIRNYHLGDDALLSMLAEFNESKIVNIAYQSENPKIGLTESMNLNKYKIYMGDTGLFVTLMFKDKDFADNTVYQELLSDKLPVNLGCLYENVVAQILTANGHELFYYVFYNQTQKRNYEVDFIFYKNHKLCPIEVKSSNYKTHESIDKFYEKFSARILNRYIVHTKDFKKDKDIICIPLYLLQFIL